MSASALAQQPVYRCGQEYTNAPADVRLCERMAAQAITVIPGPRPLAPPVNAPVSSSAAALPQQQRDDMARHIVSSELEHARERYAQLVQEYRQGDPARTAEELQHPHKYQERVARLKAAVERSQRDIDSLQRELMRRPAATSAP